MTRKIIYAVFRVLTTGIVLFFSGSCDDDKEITMPVLTTAEASEITTNTAISGGTVISDGGAVVTARGVCWSTSPDPVITGSHTSDGTGTGGFTSNITGLNPNTTYYVRAYATNAAGTAYGNQVSFTTTSGLPELTTITVTVITSTTAVSGGNITFDGGYTVTARGVCWSTSPNPVVNGSHTSDGTGTGSFASNITGLNLNTIYYVRAYASNAAGTAYGNEVSFTTMTIVTDYDGNTYNTVTIGSQVWMKENLKTTHYNNGTPIQLITGNTSWANMASGAYCYYDNNAANGNTYGALYNWYAVNTGKLCPTGWHVPTDAEWYTMEHYVDPTINDPYATGWRGTDGGTKLKATSGWNSGGNGTDDYGFSALPGGYRSSSGEFYGIGGSGYWWSSTEHGTNSAWGRDVHYDYSNVYRNDGHKSYGFSVRCVRN